MLDASGADGAPVSAIDEGEGLAILIVHPGVATRQRGATSPAC